MYKAVISDLDGTLLNSQHQVSEFTRATLQALVERGVIFVVATGRHVIDVQGIRQTMGFSCDLITSNGALVSAADDSVLVEYTLAPDLAEDLIELTAGSASYDANVYTLDGWYLAREIPELLRFHRDSGFEYTVMDLARLDMTTINKFCFTGEHRALLDLERELLARHPGQASVVFSRDDCLEVMAADVNKGHSAQRALASHALGIGEAVAFGDGMNDLEMLTLAARGYVMSNATERLRKTLPHHPLAASCDEDGVARRLIEIFGL